MWVEALKSCREYLPNKLDEVQAEYDRECGARVTRDINSLFVQASQWEQNGEFKTAVDCLLKVRSVDNRRNSRFSRGEKQQKLHTYVQIYPVHIRRKSHQTFAYGDKRTNRPDSNVPR